jgi:hypothetical protein
MAYYNLEHKKFFVHIPKCAGQSVANFLMNLPDQHKYTPMYTGHTTADQCLKFLNETYPDVSFNGFAVMRNPYYRFVSAYNFTIWQGKMVMEGRHGKLMRTKEIDCNAWQLLGELDPYNFIVEWRNYINGSGKIDFLKEIPYAIPAFRSQTSYINADTTIFVVDQNINKIKKAYQHIVGAELPTILKINQTNLKLFRVEMLDAPTKDLIAEVYAEDFLKINVDA